MAQTIQIKRSTGNGNAGNSYNTPSSLASGELAYLKNNTHQKLYIGNPGGSGDISVIGGKDFTDKLDLIGAANGTSAADARVVSSSTNLGVIRIGSGLSIATTGIVSADNQVTTSAVSGAGALMDSECTSVADLKTIDQALTSTSSPSFSAVTVNGNIEFDGLSGTGTVNVTDIKDEDDLISDSATALATQQSIKKYVDDSVPTSVANATNATNATNASNAVVTEDTNSSSAHYIGFYDNYSGTKAFKADRMLAWTPSTETLNIGTGGTFLCGDIQTTEDIQIGSSGKLKGPSTFYIDPSPSDADDIGSQNTGGTTDDTGEVVILGDLRVTGTTTTLDSQTVTTGDSIIRLNADLPHSTSAADGGFHVYRGQTGGNGSPARTNAKLIWDESESSFRVDQATGVFTTLLTAANWGSTYTGVVDGGTF